MLTRRLRWSILFYFFHVDLFHSHIIHSVPWELRTGSCEPVRGTHVHAENWIVVCIQVDLSYFFFCCWMGGGTDPWLILHNLSSVCIYTWTFNLASCKNAIANFWYQNCFHVVVLNKSLFGRERFTRWTWLKLRKIICHENDFLVKLIH